MPSEPVQPPRLILVAGAKGGVGTSLIAANAAVQLATSGRRVVAMDADPSGGDLHALVGAPPPEVPRMRLRVRRASDIERDVYAPGPTAASIDPSNSGVPVTAAIPSLSVVRAGVDAAPRGRTRRTSMREAMARARKFDCDDVVVDLGNSANESTAAAWNRAERSLFVTTPDASALEGLYRFVRCAFAQWARDQVTESELAAALGDVLDRAGGAPAPSDLLELVQRESPALAHRLRVCLADFRFPFVVNQTSMRADSELGGQLEVAIRRRYGVQVQYLGFVEADTAVSFAIRRNRPLLLESPGAKSSRAIEKLTRRHLAKDAVAGPSNRNTAPEDSYHGLLGVARAASDEEIRRAYRRMCAIFDERSAVAFGLFHADDLRAIRAHLDDANDVLLDPARRAVYESQVFPPEPSSKEAPPRQTPQEPLPAPPDITPDTLFTGALLRAVRESKGIALRDISHRTKVGAGHLCSIETEDYDQLPAAVYVRGFVMEFARYLSLNPSQVSQSYVARYESYMLARGEHT